jgi:hypothetical protein
LTSILRISLVDHLSSHIVTGFVINGGLVVYQSSGYPHGRKLIAYFFQVFYYPAVKIMDTTTDSGFIGWTGLGAEISEKAADRG